MIRRPFFLSFIAFVFALALWGVPRVGGQVQTPGGGSKAIAFPTHPRNMVQLTGQHSFLSGAVEVLYTVPLDRWLVIVPTHDGSAGIAAEVPAGLILQERLNGETQRKTSSLLLDPSILIPVSGPDSANALGWTFRPGSQVELFNVSKLNQMAKWSVFGYTVAD